MNLVSVWADGFRVRLYVAEKPVDARELSWLFDVLRRAYGG